MMSNGKTSGFENVKIFGASVMEGFSKFPLSLARLGESTINTVYNVGNSKSITEALGHVLDFGGNLINGVGSFIQTTGNNLISVGKILTFNGREQDFRNAGTLTSDVTITVGIGGVKTLGTKNVATNALELGSIQKVSTFTKVKNVATSIKNRGISELDLIKTSFKESFSGKSVTLSSGLGKLDDVLNTISKNRKELKGVADPKKKLLNGSEWNDYFKETYGAKNVTWETEITSFDDIINNPRALWGKSADDVNRILGDGWTRGNYGSKGTGWKFMKDGDKSVFYHPGDGIHEGSYYGFSNADYGKNKIVGPDYKPTKKDKATIWNME